MIFVKGLSFLLMIFTMKRCNVTQDYNPKNLSSDIMSKIEINKRTITKNYSLSEKNYLDGLQISYGINRSPNVISYGITLLTFTYNSVNSTNTDNKTIIDENTSIIEFEIWNKLEKIYFMNVTLNVSLKNTNSTSIKIMTTLDMMNFRKFPETTSVSETFEVCNDLKDAEKIYLAFFCHESETNLLEFVLSDNSTHDPLKFYMKKECNKGKKIPELNVLMTTNKSQTLENYYEYTIIEKSVTRNAESLPTIVEDKVYFYMTSEKGKQILIYPKITLNDSGVQAYLTGPGSFGGIISYSSSLLFEVIFSCEKIKTVKVSYVALVPPFENVSFSFLKQCLQVNDIQVQNEEKFDFSIGTEIGKRDVYNDEKTLREYSVEDFLENKQLKVVSAEEDATIFYISMSKRMNFKEMKVSTTDIDKVNPVIRGIVDDPNIANHFLLVYNCKNNGDTFIRVLLDIEKYKLVEFNLIKKCNVHASHNEHSSSSFIKYFWVTAGLLALLFLTIYFVNKCQKVIASERRTQSKYQEVVTELPKPQIIFH